MRSAALRGKVAIVTGGSSGIGKAIAISLARAGAHVAVVGRDRTRIDQTIDSMRNEADKAQYLGLTLDVRSEKDMEEMAAHVFEVVGRIDILVAAAGSGGTIATQRGLPFAVVQMPLEEWDEVIDTNLKGIFFSNRAVLSYMLRQGSGDIVNVSSSRGARWALPYAAAYSASKHAVMGLTESLSEEVRSLGVRVQAVLPDVTETQMMHVRGNMAPHGLLRPCMIADLVLRMLSLPAGTIMPDPLIAPFAFQ